TDEKVSVSTHHGALLSNRQNDQMIFVQVALGYLSDNAPLEYQHTPYFDIPRPLAVNRNFENETACVQNHRVLKCLSMPTASRAVFRVPSKASHFSAHVALDDSAGKRGSAVFRVYLVAGHGPELAYESPIVRG